MRNCEVDGIKRVRINNLFGISKLFVILSTDILWQTLLFSVHMSRKTLQRTFFPQHLFYAIHVVSSTGIILAKESIPLDLTQESAKKFHIDSVYFRQLVFFYYILLPSEQTSFHSRLQ